tara:strand:+ start:9919 stop:10221 length:303 start_codon:yes stop_codon:yes gene_type:complete
MANLSVLLDSVSNSATVDSMVAQPGPLASLFIALCQTVADAGEMEVVASFMMIPILRHILPRRFLWIALRYGVAVYLGLLAVRWVAVEAPGHCLHTARGE